MDVLQRYAVEHDTRYAYTAPVSQSWQLARLTPRPLPWQRLISHSLQIEPGVDERRDELDSFGNTVTHFGLHGAHRVLNVRMHCLVEIGERIAVPQPDDAARRVPWEAVRDTIRHDQQLDDLVPASMCEPTALVPYSEAALVYAAPSFAHGRPWFEAVTELMHRIHAEFEFEPGATTVSTSVDEVLYQRRGVCQDLSLIHI